MSLYIKPPDATLQYFFKISFFSTNTTTYIFPNFDYIVITSICVAKKFCT